MIDELSPISLTISGGIACYPLDEAEPRQLLGMADAALYEAKGAGRDRVQRPTVRGRRIYTMASKIEESLQFDNLHPAFQPIVDLETEAIVGYAVSKRGRRD